MKNFQSLIVILILFAASFSFAPGIYGQTGDDILAAGKPPLTQNNAAEIIRYYERGLKLKFTGEQREELQTKIVNQWRKAQKIDGKSLTAFLGPSQKSTLGTKLNAKNCKTNCAKACLAI